MKYLPIRLIGDGGYLIVEISPPSNVMSLFRASGPLSGTVLGGWYRLLCI